METKSPSCNPEMWGGIECTVNRVGNLYRDQLAESGHYNREGDIEQIAATGICKIRYPVLWENHCPDSHGHVDWQYTKQRLEDLRSRNIKPIAGLLHHGSGPSHTSLLHPDFSEQLAAYAKSVAKQFPWLEYYTPVNEPLTTARFSGLYGFWYPHQKNERSFVLMLLNQVKAIILCMQAIRTINPAAKLVQTEDLCKVHSTPALAYQAAFENERRWLTYDLLCGKFVPGHALWNYFQSLHIPQELLNFFAGNACPPDIMGFNYYITSERYLDENLHHYPLHVHGSNGIHCYADTDAARVNKRAGLQSLLQEAWQRYHIPMAITECHINCSREEQMRWLQETWNTCCQLNKENIPVVALTAWCLLGAFDWDSLLLYQNDHYESGVFDVRTGQMQPTILVQMIKAFAKGRTFHHPLLAGQGWWHTSSVNNQYNTASTAPLLIIQPAEGHTKELELVCHGRKIYCQLLSMNLAAEDSVAQIMQRSTNIPPWGVIISIQNNNEAITGVPLLEQLMQYCAETALPLMLLINSNEYTDELQNLLSHSDTCLIIQHNHLDGMKLVHHAMDLFIDGCKGAWMLNGQHVRKIGMEEPALLY